MKKKKDSELYLQHKLPWESEWEDVAIGNDVDCDKFKKILESEPPHLIETEYRIIRKKMTELKNKNKSVICPVCIMRGTEMSKQFEGVKTGK